jgi:hypothetical protein
MVYSCLVDLIFFIKNNQNDNILINFIFKKNNELKVGFYP